jgi:hypothetical protein
MYANTLSLVRSSLSPVLAVLLAVAFAMLICG